MPPQLLPSLPSLPVARFFLPRVGQTAALTLAAVLAACGGGTGNERDSGANKTYLTVDATDPDGNANTLSYQWRVTAGSVENRNAKSTVWTLPDGPGLHFAYVSVNDGQGGYVEQQYAVSSDALNTPLPERVPITRAAPAVSEAEGTALRLRLVADGEQAFAVPGVGGTAARAVYLPDARVQVRAQASNALVFDGRTDLSGEIPLPKLQVGQRYALRCASSDDAPLENCGNLVGAVEASVRVLLPVATEAQNLRLFGHISLADGTLCGMQSEFFNIESAAAVSLQKADGTALTRPTRVNRFGDYAINAAVPVKGPLRLKVQCESYSRVLDVPAPTDPAGYNSNTPVELSHAVANSRPRIVKMVGNGGDGNVRGQMLLPEANAASNGLPGADHFLTYKGKDTKLSACMYYRALGAVKDCDAQGNMIEPISFDDWKRAKKLAPYTAGNVEVVADYINKMDLNLVRHMVATQSGPQDIAFYVCNSPGPVGTSQREIDETLAFGVDNLKRVACVAMEWSATPGANGGKPFTKFLTFGPDGGLLLSVNLDGRGEKYLPGTCVACHGGSQYNGRFPTKAGSSASLGTGFLGFDTNNYFFASAPNLSEAAQSTAFYKLNQLARATETADDSPLSNLVKGWYANGSTTQNKRYVPAAWLAADALPATAGAATFYREVVGSSCRTCHASLGARFDWDSIVLNPGRARNHVCGGTSDLAINASMPNALISRDRVLERVNDSAELKPLMTRFLGCTQPLPDPAYARR
jgi:mono/diheme cytochrome c family protein